MTRQVAWTVGLLFVGAAARLSAALWLGDGLHYIDEGVYLDAARRLLAGEGFDAAYRNVPAYPVALAALATPWPDSVVMIRCAQAVVTAAGVVPLLILGGRMLGPGPARVAGALYALDPLMVVAGGLLYAEALAAVVLLAALLAAWSAARDDRLAWSLAAGLLLGVLAQFRPVALLLIPVVALWTAGVVRHRRAWHAVAIVAACVAALTPWTVRNHHVRGGLQPISTAGVHSAGVPRQELAERGLTGGLAARMWRRPVDAIRKTGREFARFWELYPTRLATDAPRARAALQRKDPRLPSEAVFRRGLRDQVSAVTFAAEAALALVGLVLAWRRHRAIAMLLAAISFAYAFGYSLFMAKLRYRITVLPCLFLLAGLGAWTLVRRWRTASTPRDRDLVLDRGRPSTP